MKRYIFSFIIVVCIASLLMQCEKNNNSEDIKWTTYTTEDGLANNRVTDIAIDAEGNKWFGTCNGVSKFDGTNWTTYNTLDGLVHNVVNVIAIDAEGNKWFGTCNRVSKFDGTNWTTYDTLDGLVHNVVNVIAIDAEGNKWFGSSYSGNISGGENLGGVSQFDGTSWTTYSLFAYEGYISDITTDAEGNIWRISNNTVTDHSRIVKFNGADWEVYKNFYGFSVVISKIAIDVEGIIWLVRSANYGGGIIKLDGTNEITYNTSDGLASNDINAIAIDAKGNKWFGTNGGVSKLADTTWTNYTTEDGLVNDTIYAIAIDAEGNKWFGTPGGVSKYSGD